jgi:hypothetical protein
MNKEELKNIENHRQDLIKENNTLTNLLEIERKQVGRLAEQLNLSGVVDMLPQDPIILARYLHEAYEMLAKNNDWNTQENCKVDFSDLPIGNKNTMILLAGKLILDFGGN